MSFKRGTQETYRVAEQSVSAVLENDDASEQGNGDDKNGHGDIRQSLQEHTNKQSEYPLHEVDDPEQLQSLSPQSPGDPQAYWPSQRPMRVNPRLMQYYREQQHQQQLEKPSDFLNFASSTMSSTSSLATTAQNDTRRVAKRVLRALQDDDNDNDDETDSN